MRTESMETTVERLRAVRWSSAPEWRAVARDLLFDYYQRMLPVWSPTGADPMPDNSQLIEGFLSRLSGAERVRIDEEKARILQHAHENGLAPTLMTRALLSLVLACATLVESGELRPEEDPGEPLLRLFEAGYELNPTHGGVDVCYATGMTTVPLPRRDAIARRTAATRM
jgi:hypothetical protein